MLFFNQVFDNHSVLSVFLQKGTKIMPYLINKDDCIQCGACEAECPESAIVDSDGEYVVDPSLCKDCGSCADVCPNNAISPA